MHRKPETAQLGVEPRRQIRAHRCMNAMKRKRPSQLAASLVQMKCAMSLLADTVAKVEN
jgi:hypothetical protein